MCQRMIQPIGNRIISAQCYFKDDPLNAIVSDLNVKDYQNIYPKNLNEVDFLGGNHKVEPQKLFKNFTEPKGVFTLESFETELYTMIKKYGSETGIFSLDEDIKGIENLIDKIMEEKKKFYNYMEKEFFVYFLKAKFKVNIINVIEFT